MSLFSTIARLWRPAPVLVAAPVAPAADVIVEPEPVTEVPSMREPVAEPDGSAQGMVFVTGIVKPPVGTAWVTPVSARPHQVRKPHEGDA